MFNRALRRKVSHGKFDLSHEFKFTCDMGDLIPVCCQEVLPGDKFKCSNTAVIKLTAQLAPVMHNVQVYFRSFFVPNRIIWTNWEEFITGGKDGSSTPTVPFVNLNNISKGSLFDYLYKIPTGISANCKVSALPLRAYNFICNEFFRDQALQNPLTVNLTDGEDNTNLYSLQKVLWEKDYFTSARASAQAGSGAVMPLGTTAPVKIKGDGKNIILYDKTTSADLVTDGHGVILGSTAGTSRALLSAAPGAGTADEVSFNPDYAKSGLTGEADLSNASPVSIETLRNAFKIQEYLEKLNRSGHHIKDWLLAFFGVKTSDARLNLPEYLGGGVQQILFNELLQTSETDTTALGTQAGHSTSIGNSKIFKKYFEEHGWFLTLMYIRPRTQYMQGVDRQFTRETRYDYYLPEFSNLGEQAIKNKELYFTGTADDDEATFGYQTRFQEYRSVESKVAGEMRDSLKYWTMARDFANAPQLNEQFLQCDATKRIYATQGMSNHVIVDCANYIHAVRPIPRYVRPATLF